MGSHTDYKTAHRNVSYLRFIGAVFRIPTQIKNPVTTDVVTGFLVGVSGFEPEASWTRTKRDTKLRHTPIAKIL